ncbi:MAG: hypothetical protein CMO01_32560 [Thalassobius sp.]|nr:hypothetical protein [Thalassovita sp.]
MGLDTVELIMAFEDKFNVQISDADAGKVSTVSDVIEWLCAKLNIDSEQSELKDTLFSKVNTAFFDLGFITESLEWKTKLKEVLPKEEVEKHWNNIEYLITYKLPKLNKSDLGILEKKRSFLGMTIFDSKSPFLDNDVERFIDCIGALNYKRLIDFSSLSDVFEVKIAVIGITMEHSGVDIDEIFLTSTFTGDLGMD